MSVSAEQRVERGLRTVGLTMARRMPRLKGRGMPRYWGCPPVRACKQRWMPQCHCAAMPDFIASTPWHDTKPHPWTTSNAMNEVSAGSQYMYGKLKSRLRKTIPQAHVHNSPDTRAGLAPA